MDNIKMFRQFFLSGAFLAVGDPILLFMIYSRWGIGALLATLILPLIGMKSIPLLKAKHSENQNPDQQGQIGEEMLFFAARLLFLYPGPISSILGFLLLLPGVRRWIRACALARLQRAVASGKLSAFVQMGGVTVNPGFVPNMSSNAAFGGLKQAEGRVIESTDPSLNLDADGHDAPRKLT